MHDVVSVQHPLIDLRANACVLMCRVASRSFLAQGATDILKPLGLGEGAKFPLSPKSERAYTRISHEFDVLLQALQAEADVTHSDPPVRPPLTALSYSFPHFIKLWACCYTMSLEGLAPFRGAVRALSSALSRHFHKR